MTTTHSSTIKNIQALRFFAAFSVTVFHTLPHYQAAGGSSTIPQFSFGMYGVDLFFVVSGYVSALTTERLSGAAVALQYASKRFLRIFSGYLPWAFVMVAILSVFSEGELEQKDLLKSFLLIPQDFATALNPVAWTLSLELWFYFLFAGLLLVPQRLLAVAISYFLAAILICQAWGAHPFFSSFIFSPYLLEFFSGAALFVLLKEYPDVSLHALFVTFAGAVIFSYSLSFGEDAPLDRVFLAGVCSVFVVAFAVLFERRNWVAPAFFVQLGDSSYTLYLLHNTVLVLVAYTFRDSVSGFPGWFYFSLVVVMIVTSHIWWLMYEQRAYSLLVRKLALIELPQSPSFFLGYRGSAQVVWGAIFVSVIALGLSKEFFSGRNSSAWLLFDVSLSAEERFTVRNAEWSLLGGGGLSLAASEDPMIVIDIMGELEACSSFSVSFSIVSQSRGFAQLFFLPRGTFEFTESNSKIVALSGNSEEQDLSFIVNGDSGFEGTLRLDPVSDAEASNVTALQVWCLKRPSQTGVS